jgi:hypothetical protein
MFFLLLMWRTIKVHHLISRLPTVPQGPHHLILYHSAVFFFQIICDYIVDLIVPPPFPAKFLYRSVSEWYYVWR